MTRLFSSRRTWLQWLLGLALLGAVLVVALGAADAGAFVAVLARAEPWWIAIAVLLQLATYVAEGEGWHVVARAGGAPFPRPLGWRASLVKLFVDQALPSAGVGGTAVFATTLIERGLPRPVVAAAVVLDAATYYIAYAVCLAIALAIASAHADVALVAIAIAFVLFGIGITTLTLWLAGRERGPIGRFLGRFRLLRPAIQLFEDADRRLTRDTWLIARASLCQAGVFVADALSLWVCVRAIGGTVGLDAAFATMMLATLFRTIGIVPGGLGTFDAAAVVTLDAFGVGVAVALPATLLFRGLSFWLPLAPGFWFTRQRAHEQRAAPATIPAWWSLPVADLTATLDASTAGLTTAAAAERLARVGPNLLARERTTSAWSLLVRQLKSPLLLLLVVAAGVAAVAGAWLDASIVGVIVLASAGIGWHRELRAQSALDALRARVSLRATALRDGAPREVPANELVPGDVVLLAAGSLVPADARLLEAADLHVSESLLTGESFPVAKAPDVCAASAPLGRRGNALYMGTNVRSGSARALVVATGASTELGAIAHRLTLRPPESEFDRGIRRFGNMLSVAMLALVVVVFGALVLQGRAPVEGLLFAVALAVGLSPELLPAILAVNLARGAARMAERGVLVRRLPAIEDLGSIDVLCTDKTGTLTKGVVELAGAYGADGVASARVLTLAGMNASLETGLANPLDEAIRARCAPLAADLHKLGEVPFDFIRKRTSVIVRTPDGVTLVTKGAVRTVLDACATLTSGQPLDAATRADLDARHEAWSAQGIRVLAVATRALPDAVSYSRDDERELVLEGFLTFLDEPKPSAAGAIASLRELGVAVKLITGDARAVAFHTARAVGLGPMSGELRMLTGDALDHLSDPALWREAERTDIFAEVDPNQKERIILALKKMGHVVGFLGDGVNDAPAMHASDTSLSVDGAADVAREAADFVLLEPDLAVIRAGIEEGRRTFANTLKYVLTTTSANLGNMLSMALASILFLPFLPLTAGQILLNNFLSDVPAFGLANDRVDPELVAAPRRWDMRFIGRFMVEFGVVSSLFDLLTFGILLGVFEADLATFRTGWFVESLLTELVIALVVRTRRPFYASKPGRFLLWSTVALALVTLIIPILPFAGVLGFVPLPPALVATLIGITCLYVAATEGTKRWFYRARSEGAVPPARP